jgi:hypothetical protein
MMNIVGIRERVIAFGRFMDRSPAQPQQFTPRACECKCVRMD